MANRQYIGARYVPQFFENPNGGSEWLSGVAYEALTIVTYANNSYTSKIPVPVGIGAPNENPSYWAQTGVYNEQVEQYRKEVEALNQKVNTETDERIDADDEIKDEIKKMQEKLFTNFILISDSYGTVSDNFITLLSPNYPNGKFSAIGGTGFGSSVYITDSWLSMLNALQIDDHSKVTAIYCIGGANDANLINDGRLTESTLNGYIDAFYTAAQTMYPNATIYVSMVGWHRTASLTGYEAVQRIYMEACERHNHMSYISGLDTLFHNCLLLSTSDNIHPTAYGSQLLAKYLAPLINSGGTYAHIRYGGTIPAAQFAKASNVSELSELAVNYIVNGDQLTLDFIGNTDKYLDFAVGFTTAIASPAITSVIELFSIPIIHRATLATQNVDYLEVNFTAGASASSSSVYNCFGTIEYEKNTGKTYLRPRVSGIADFKRLLITSYTVHSVL